MEKGWVIALFVIVIALLLLVVPLRFGAFLGISQSPPGASFQGESLGSVGGEECFDALAQLEGKNSVSLLEIDMIKEQCETIQTEDVVAYIGSSRSGESCPSDRYDIDGNGEAGFAEILEIISNWHCTDCPGDINGDGIANFEDILNILAHWHCVVENVMFKQQLKLFASNADQGDRYGRGIDVEGNLLVVGAQRDPALQQTGLGYVYRYDGLHWEETQIVEGSRVAFGTYVKIKDGLVFMSDSDDGSTPRVYVYEDDGEQLMEKQIIIRNGADSDFGADLDLFNDRLLIGAPNDERVIPYHLEESGWVIDQQALIQASNIHADNDFGRSISMEGDLAIIGSPDANSVVDETGSVYVFEFDGAVWIETDILLPDDAMSGQNFGYDVSLDGDWLAIGASGDNTNGDRSGAVYMFQLEEGKWVQKQKLIGSEVNSPSAFFGETLELEGQRLAIGARISDYGAPNAGEVYVFELDPESDLWVETQILISDNSIEGEQFGWDLGLSGNLIGIGVFQNNERGLLAGAAYIFNAGLCGDGFVNQPGEVCDDGVNNGMGFEYCSLDCASSSGVVSSGVLSPFGFTARQDHNFGIVPRAQSDVTVTIKTHGDFGSSDEFVDVKLNGGPSVGRLFEANGVDCEILEESVVVSATDFNAKYTGAELVIEPRASGGVGPGSCSGDTWVEIQLGYTPE